KCGCLFSLNPGKNSPHYRGSDQYEVGKWHEVARKLGIPRSEQELMRPAFPTDSNSYPTEACGRGDRIMQQQCNISMLGNEEGRLRITNPRHRVSNIKFHRHIGVSPSLV